MGGSVQEAQKLGDEYLALEKYVNLNYMVRPHCYFACHRVSRC